MGSVKIWIKCCTILDDPWSAYFMSFICHFHLLPSQSMLDSARKRRELLHSKMAEIHSTPPRKRGPPLRDSQEVNIIRDSKSEKEDKRLLNDGNAFSSISCFAFSLDWNGCSCDPCQSIINGGGVILQSHNKFSGLWSDFRLVTSLWRTNWQENWRKTNRKINVYNRKTNLHLCM